MTDAGWDIPGVPRDAPPPAAGHAPASEPNAAAANGGPAARDGSPANRSSGRAARSSNRRRPSVSVSAAAGSSAGAFACSAADSPGPADSLAGPPANGALGDAGAPGAADTLTGDPAAAGATGASSPAPCGHGATDAASPADPVAAVDPAQALAFLRAGLDFLAHADPAGWTAGLQADCLRALAVAEARQAAAHAKVLAAFSVPGGGLAGDGHASPRAWLTWQTQATRRAATVQVARMRSLRQHPKIAAALADGVVSLSWARQLIDWSDRLPELRRDDADQQLLEAAAAGAALSDLFFIAEELRRDHSAPDDDRDDGFTDRAVQFATTFDGAGRLEGDLTPRCAAAVDAVLGSLSARRGPEDDRSVAQRQHDALEEACTRLLAAGSLPERAGQPVRLELNITLDELARNGQGSPAGPGAACDAVIQPVITGLVDHDLLDQLARAGQTGPTATTAAGDRAGRILAQAIALLSGPAGHAAWLRRQAGDPAATGISLPLDIAGTLDTIPVHLRRAVRSRDRHCRFPGCDIPPAGCDVHHLIHRKDGGPHSLTNLALFCRFHHLVAIHRWGWQVTLHPDGTTTAVSPDGAKTLRSHPPPKLVA
ncbi:MAG TPA: DUF222 domain-containing protein [Streptosporangiaceae bacterium]|nr:DUF222 domain-containing protein [Streptosporangiaceae bacterium]